RRAHEGATAGEPAVPGAGQKPVGGDRARPRVGPTGPRRNDRKDGRGRPAQFRPLVGAGSGSAEAVQPPGTAGPAAQPFVPRRAEIGAYVTQVVQNWDAATLVNRLELQVGKDLQYIRINGTLVGGLVGLLIFMASKWIASG